MMIDPKKLDELAEKIAKIIPPGFQELQAELKRDVKVIIQSALSKLDLITREEFDVQTKVLLRQKKQIAELEKKIEALQTKLEQPAKKASKKSDSSSTSKK